MSTQSLVPKHGGYRRFKTFELARLVYDVTIDFCNRHIEKRSRKHDQMVQAARSGVQNIVEGSEASGTSKKTELKLTNVARASLVELRLDYEDYLRQRGLAEWPRGDPRRNELVARRLKSADEGAAWVRESLEKEHGANGPQGLHVPQRALHMESVGSMGSMQSKPPELAHAAITANAALVLIGVATALLGRQIQAQAAAFEREGGFTERLYRVRQERRGRGLFREAD